MNKLFAPISFIFVLATGIIVYPFIGYCGEGVESMRPQSKQVGGAPETISHKALFHLDLNQEDRLTLALANIKNLFREIPAQQCDVSVVANGNAVNLFKKNAVPGHGKTIEELHNLGVNFKMCRNALANNKISKEDLIDVCEIVPAGILEIIDLQRMGFAYIKP
jgi:uncharacterized protein